MKIRIELNDSERKAIVSTIMDITGKNKIEHKNLKSSGSFGEASVTYHLAKKEENRPPQFNVEIAADFHPGVFKGFIAIGVSAVNMFKSFSCMASNFFDTWFDDCETKKSEIVITEEHYKNASDTEKNA